MSAPNVSIRLALRGLAGIALLLLAVACILSSILALGEFGKSEHIALYFISPLVAALICGSLAIWIYPELAD